METDLPDRAAEDVIAPLKLWEWEFASHPELPIILLAGDRSADELVALQDTGADCVFDSQVSPETLIQALQDLFKLKAIHPLNFPGGLSYAA